MEGTGSPAMRVRATRKLQYAHQIRRAGDVFDLLDAREFNPRVMEVVDDATTLRSSSPQSAIDVEVGAANIRNRGRRLSDGDIGQVLTEFDPFEERNARRSS